MPIHLQQGETLLLCLSKTLFADLGREEGRERFGNLFYPSCVNFFFSCSSMLFVSMTIDGVIPFHSVVWLCPIMPSRSVSACPSLVWQEGDCWARQSPFSH